MPGKKRINNGAFIKVLAPLLGSDEGDELATAAQAYADILGALGIKPNIEKFEGCDQAQKLARWIWHEEEPNVDEIKQWTADIVAAIGKLAAGDFS